MYHIMCMLNYKYTCLVKTLFLLIYAKKLNGIHRISQRQNRDKPKLYYDNITIYRFYINNTYV